MVHIIGEPMHGARAPSASLRVQSTKFRVLMIGPLRQEYAGLDINSKSVLHLLL
jgi:hypothetical protein